MLVLSARHARIDDIGDPEEGRVAFGLQRPQLRVDRLDAVAELAHPRFHRVARRTAFARTVALGFQRLRFGQQLPDLRVELDDPVEGRLEAARLERRANFVRVLADALKRGHRARAIIRALPCSTSFSWPSKVPTATHS